jgi:chaperone required for assembly of F1-ATPase
MTMMTDESDDDRMIRLMKDQYVRPLPKRFYKTVSITAGNAIALDGRLLKTPMKAALTMPSRAIAELVAAEWDAQQKVINPGAMPYTKLVNTAIDRATSERAAILKELVDYAGSDLICYRASTPPDLVRRQNELWNPALAWAENKLSAKFEISKGVSHVKQDPAALAIIHHEVALLDNFRLTIMFNLTTLLGSALLPLMLIKDDCPTAEVWQAAHCDEDYQISHWGQDPEAQKRRAGRRTEYDAYVKILALLNDAAPSP